MKKQIISFLSLLLLCSCSSKNNTETAKPTETEKTSITEKMTETISTEDKTEITASETSDSSIITEGVHRMTRDDIPTTEQSRYNLDFDFEAAGISYHGDYLQRGTGEYDGTIQMKKEQSYFYNQVAVKGKLIISIKDKGQYTGTPTLYVGNSANPEEEANKVAFSSRQESDAIIYEAEVNGFFRFADESARALYLNYAEIDCTGNH